MSLENAKQNLKEFGKELNLEGLAFDENHTCILGIDNTFSLHLTYEPNSDRLYLYSPVLDGLPKDPQIRLKLYEALLEGSMLGGQMAGGGVGGNAQGMGDDGNGVDHDIGGPIHDGEAIAHF